SESSVMWPPPLVWWTERRVGVEAVCSPLQRRSQLVIQGIHLAPWAGSGELGCGLFHPLGEFALRDRGSRNQCRVEQGVEAVGIAVDRDGAGVGEDVRVDLVPVDDPSGLDR